MNIYCPKCSWKPTSNSRWMCALTGCGFVWNTFDTHGQCPNCFKQWRETQCLLCKQFSLHEDWYHDEEPVEKEQREETLIVR